MRAVRLLYWPLVLVLAAPALAITLARASDLEAGLVVRATAFTPLAIPLWAAVTLLLLAGALITERDRRPPRLVATAVALAALGLHLWWFSPQVLGARPQPAAGAPTLTIMNANVYLGHGDAAQVVGAVRRYHVDILATEEINSAELAALHAAGLSELLPHEGGQSSEARGLGTMVFARKPITDVVDLHTALGSYELSVDGLRIIAAHPLSPQYPQGWLAEHAEIRKVADHDHVDMIVGDLNATPDHTVIRRLADDGYRDVPEEANQGWQPTWPSNHIGVPSLVPPVVRIDHVLVRSTLAGLGSTTVDIDGTDHRALVARVARTTSR